MTRQQEQRVSVIDPYVLRHVMEHPARGRRWTIRELARHISWGRAALGHLSSGARTTLPADVAARIAEAVGVHPAVLFTPWPSTESEAKESK